VRAPVGRRADGPAQQPAPARRTLREAWHQAGIRHTLSKIGNSEVRAFLPSTQVSALSDFLGRVVELTAVPKSVFLALRRFLLVTGSNAIRTCVQGFTELRDTASR
jgi:hypothetical protein